jgi:hypothetical protein
MKNFKLFINYNILTTAGFVFLFIGTMGTWGKLIDYNIYKNGRPILAKVLEAPTDCNKISSRGGYCTLEYQNRKYVIKAGNKFCYLVSGQKTVKMLTDEEGTDLSFPGEFTYFELFLGLLFLAIGLFCVIKYYKSLSKIKQELKKTDL